MQEKNLSLKQYRSLDLAVWAVLMIIFEFLSYKAATKWFADQLYSVSLVPALVTIVIMRWDYFGLIHALLGGFVYSFLAEGTVLQFMCYLVGNTFCVGSVIVMKAVGRDKIRNNSVLSAVFAVIVSLCMHLGRAVVCFCLGFGLGESVSFITTDVLSGVFAVVVVVIARRLDGVFEDQKTYLLRVQKELKEEQGRD